MNSLKMLKNEDIFEALKYINVPTGIFHGKEDKICPFPMAEIMNKNIRFSTLFSFENAGHGAFYEDKNSYAKTKNLRSNKKIKVYFKGKLLHFLPKN